MIKEISALEVLADRGFVAQNAAHARREMKPYNERKAIDMQAYREGEANAYNEAHKVMTKELKRLCNLFQNGSLQISDFNIVL